MPRADAVTINVTGMPDVMKALEELPKGVQRRQIVKALNFAATPILRDARRRVPRRTGTLAKSLGRRTKRYRRSGGAVVVIGPRIGPRFNGVDPKTGKKIVPNNYAHLVEFGTVRSRAKPFMRSAFDSNANSAKIRFRLKLQEGITAELRKIEAKNKEKAR